MAVHQRRTSIKVTQPHLVSYPSRNSTSVEDDKAFYYPDYVADYPTYDDHTHYPPSTSKLPQPSYSASTFELESQTQPPLPTLKPQKELAGTGRSWWSTIMPESIACRLYVLTVLLETCIDLALEADIFARFKEQNITIDGDDTTLQLQRLPVYLAIFAMAHLFQLVMAVDAVRARNTLQFLFLTIFNALFLVYAIIQISELQIALQPGVGGVTHLSVKTLTTIIPIVISIAEVAYIALGWKIYKEFGWKVYKELGADVLIKRIFAHYQIFECLLKFNVFFWTGYSVQFIILVLDHHDWEYFLTCGALPLSLLLLLEGHYAAKLEKRWMMATFMISCVAGCCYFIYKLYRLTVLRSQNAFNSVFKSLATFSSLSIFLLVLTFTWACILMMYFDGGLKDQMKRRALKSSGTVRRPGVFAKDSYGGRTGDPNRISRMTID